MNIKYTIICLMTILNMFGISENILKEPDISPKEECFHELITEERNEINLPILMYHHITPEAVIVKNDMTITPECFEKHVQDMIAQGYTPVFLEEIIAYVESGDKLPEKPICITFDDGYLSNYEYAFPVLKKYNVKANIAVIGSSIGLDKYKNTEHEIIPHFTINQAKEMEDSGLVSIISHTYDMHQAFTFESGDKIRINAVELQNESAEEYEIALKRDFEKMSEILLENFEKKSVILAYPYGRYSELSNEILKECGVKITLATSMGINKIEKGNKESLYNLHRYTVHQTFGDVREMDEKTVNACD